MRRGDLRSDAGISLIEIMVALFIIGLASGFVILSIPPSPTPLEKVRREFEEAIYAARISAEIGGEARGLRIVEKQVSPLIFRHGNWQAPTGFRDGASFIVPEEVDFSLPEAPRQRFRTTEQEDEIVRPDIWFDPSGFASEYEFRLEWKNDQYWFAIDMSGEVSVNDTRNFR